MSVFTIGTGALSAAQSGALSGALRYFRFVSAEIDQLQARFATPHVGIICLVQVVPKQRALNFELPRTVLDHWNPLPRFRGQITDQRSMAGTAPTGF